MVLLPRKNGNKIFEQVLILKKCLFKCLREYVKKNIFSRYPLWKILLVSTGFNNFSRKSIEFQQFNPKTNI